MLVGKRDVIAIDDLTNEEIESIFRLTDEYLETMRQRDAPHRIRGKTSLASGFILSTLFYEASTRTRFSFESAMLRLGGGFSGFGNAKETSVSKGETIADTVRVIENYADIIVIRHPLEGAALVAAEFASVPIINAGDGSHEHPTQTLCDLYTLRRENKSLKGLNVLICGDLKHGRTVHSLCYALARFGAHIIPWPAKGLELPAHVHRRLEVDYHCISQPWQREGDSDLSAIDAVYVTHERPNQLTLFSSVEVGVKLNLTPISPRIDVFYVTRLQQERLTAENEDNGKRDDGGEREEYPVIDKKFLSQRRFTHTTVLHPLPRIKELGYDLDNDPRGVYFKQAAYGVPVRMALIASLLELAGTKGILQRDTRPSPPYPVYSCKDGIRCENKNCVTVNAVEKRQLNGKFWVIELGNSEVILRCVYCENERSPMYVGRKSSKRYYGRGTPVTEIELADRVYFASESEAQSAGYTQGKQTRQSSRSRKHRAVEV
jgi:aspartate carbamoyltransferase catalytic subunit